MKVFKEFEKNNNKYTWIRMFHTAKGSESGQTVTEFVKDKPYRMRNSLVYNFLGQGIAVRMNNQEIEKAIKEGCFHGENGERYFQEDIHRLSLQIMPEVKAK